MIFQNSLFQFLYFSRKFLNLSKPTWVREGSWLLLVFKWLTWNVHFYWLLLKAIARRYSVAKVLLEISQNSQENTCARVSFLIKFEGEACNFIKKESLTQLFSSEFWEISKKTFFIEHSDGWFCIHQHGNTEKAII